MILRVLIAFALLLAGCASSTRYHSVVQRELVPVDARIQQIIEDEQTWRFPNSMALDMSEDACEMRLEVVRARLLLNTQAVSRDLQNWQCVQLLRQMQRTEDCRALATARLLAAAGVAQSEINAAAPDALRGSDVLKRVVSEGRGIRELG
ncbi:MAG: hypothetical protein R3E76_15935 [Planctomycetota bacterium]